MDENTRKGIAMAFRAAKKHLWDGKSRVMLEDVKETYICYALELTKHPRAGAAITIVIKRLGNSITLGQWLARHGVAWSEQTNEKIQAHRHAWLDQLIEEFES